MPKIRSLVGSRKSQKARLSGLLACVVMVKKLEGGEVLIFELNEAEGVDEDEEVTCRGRRQS